MLASYVSLTGIDTVVFAFALIVKGTKTVSVASLFSVERLANWKNPLVFEVLLFTVKFSVVPCLLAADT